VRTCLILSGHNDAFAGASPGAMLRDMADCVLVCRLRGVEPVVLGPIPVRSAAGRDRSAQERTLAAWNRLLAAFCSENGIRFVDLRAVVSPAQLDPATGNHLTDAGMTLLAEVVRASISSGGH
jgi:hypothetical protein